MTTLVGPYASAVHVYRDAGWLGVLPLPTLSKTPPPDGYTGHQGPWPDDGQIQRWAEGAGEGNLALRVPSGVVGIDVDHYGTKRGADILAELEAQWGPLPPTWVSTSRPWPSGIRLFRAPIGQQFQTVIPGGIEVVQHHHRYLVAWPSIHPDTGGMYQWVDPDGDLPGRPPDIEDLPDLPPAWVEGLARPWSTTAERVDNGPTVEHREPVWSEAVTAALERVTFHPGGRHDAATAGAMGLARLEQLGHPGATTALDALGERFVAAVTAPGEGRRSPASAQREWSGPGGILPSARERARTSPAAAEPYIDPSWMQEWVAANAPAVADGNGDGIGKGSSWRRTPLAATVQGLVDGTIQRQRPTLGLLPDGTGLFYPGKVNGLYGEPGKGKTWVALGVASEVLGSGGTVAWIDLEEPAHGIVERLLTLQVAPDAIAERFAHYAPEESIANAVGLAEELAAVAPTLIVIDSTGEALAIEGAGPNNDDEVATWFRTWPRWMANHTGAGVIVIDHVVKDESNRGLWPGGSQRKKAAINGSAFMASTVTELGRGHEGRLKLTTSKDRQGHHRVGVPAAIFVLDATRGDIAGHRLDFPLPGRDRSDALEERMRQVSDWLGEQGEQVSKAAITRAVPGNNGLTADAIEALTTLGYIRQEQRARGHWCTLERPYAEAEASPSVVARASWGAEP